MRNLTIKNIPDELYEQLKYAAQVHRRSMNSEVLYCVERTLLPRKIDVSELLATARILRAKTAANPINDDEMNDAINEARP